MSKNYGHIPILINLKLNKILYQKNNENISFLSIVIPTYDRVENLKKLLTHIAAEKYLKNVEIIILDNCSNSIIPNTFFLELFEGINITYIQNKFHLGPDFNYLKSIELAHSDWIYPIGDSKIPIRGFVEILLKDIQEFKESYGIVYKYASQITNNMNISNFAKIAPKNIHIGDFFLGGNSIISKKSLKDYLCIAGQLTLTRMPHISFHLMPLLNNQQITLRKDNIIDIFLQKPAHYDPKLSYLECLGQFALIDVITNNWKFRKIINKKIFQIYGEIWRIIYHTLKFTFKHRIDVSSNMHRIIKFRFMFNYGFFSLFVIYLLFVLTRFLKLINYAR